MRRLPVRIISPKRIREAVAAHSEWEASLLSWLKLAKNGDWKNFADIKRTWRNCDKVGSCVVFDIQNNRCRLITRVFYEAHRIYILHVLSHPEYLKDRWKNDCDCS